MRIHLTSWLSAALPATLLCASATPSRSIHRPATALPDTGYTADSTPPRRIRMHGVVEVPLLRPNAGDSRAQVEVIVNGRGPYRFDVETGAREIGLSRAVAESLGLKRIGGPDDYREYHLDSIGVGSATFYDMPVAQLPPGVRGVDGVLGLPFYQNVLLTIDYPAHRVRFSNGSLPKANGADIVALTRIDAFWGVPITIAGKPFDAVLDTQNSGALNLPPDVADQLSFDGGLAVVGRARGNFGTIEIKGGRLAGEVGIGRYRFPSPFVDVVPLPPDYPRKANIGSRLLDSFVVVLDQRHGRLQLSHPGSTIIRLPRPSPRRGTPTPPPDGGLEADSGGSLQP